MKKFRSRVISFVGALGIITCLTACGSGGKDALIGTWDGEGSVFGGNREIAITFYEDGTGSADQEGRRNPIDFIWDIEGKNLTISEPDGSYPDTLTYEFSNKDRTLTLVYHSDYDNTDYTFTYYRKN